MALKSKQIFSALRTNFLSVPIKELQFQIAIGFVLICNVSILSPCLAIQVTMYKESVDKNCITLLNATSGNITVPRSLLKTGDFIQCEWIISPGGPLDIHVHFLHIDLPRSLENDRCFGTFLEYGSFDNVGRKVVMGEACGTISPQDFISDKNRVWLKYYYLPTQGGSSTLPFLVNYQAKENGHLRNTIVVTSSFGTLGVVAVAGCLICYCQRKKRKDLYYNKRRQQKRLNNIKKRAGLHDTPLQWNRVAFKSNLHGQVNRHVSRRKVDPISSSCSTTTTSVATCLKFPLDDLGLSVGCDTVCQDPTKYEDISDYLPSDLHVDDFKHLQQNDLEPEVIYLQQKDLDREATYLSLQIDRSNNGLIPNMSRTTMTGNQRGMCDQAIFSFGTCPNDVKDTTSRDSLQQSAHVFQSGDSGMSRNTNDSPKLSHVPSDRFLSCASIDSAFQRVSPMFHSTPDLDLACVKSKMNIPAIHINDQLVLPQSGQCRLVYSRKMSASAPDLGVESPIHSSGQDLNIMTPYPNSNTSIIKFSSDRCHCMSITCTKHHLPSTIARARPRPVSSPLAGVGPGQIHAEKFTPKSETEQMQARANHNHVTSCLFEQNN